MAYVTEHAAKRMKERMGLSKKSLERIANKAYEKGLTMNEVKGEVLSYMINVRSKSAPGTKIKLYADKTWIFTNGNLVTIYNTPSTLKHKVDKFSKAGA